MRVGLSFTGPLGRIGAHRLNLFLKFHCTAVGVLTTVDGRARLVGEQP